MNTGNYCFRFYANSDYTPQYLISPELASSATGIDVSFYYRSLTGSNTTKFSVGYSTTGTNISDFTWSDEVSYAGSYTSCNYSFGSGTKYIAIKYSATDNSCHLYIDDFSVSAIDPYKTPTSFALNSYNANSATFSWTAGNSETAWQFDYSTDPDFSPGSGINGTNGDITTGDLVDGKYTLSGLTTNTTYYASIRANYGGGNYSEWTDKVSFTPRAESETTINNVSPSFSSYALIYTSSIKNYLIRTQFIIPSASLTSVKDRQITKLTFYSANTASSDLGNGKFEVYLKETDDNSYSSTTINNWGTNVYNSATLSISDYSMEVNLNTPFNYSGGNLQVGIKQTEKASSQPYISWYYVSGTTNSFRLSTDDAAATRYSYSPKMTITSIPITTAPVKIGSTGFTTFSSTWPLDLSSLPDGLTAYYASSQDGNNVTLTKATTEVSAGTGLVLKGTAGQTYAIPVAASGSDISGNLLVGVTSETAVAASATKYVLVNNGGTAEFQSLEENGATIPGGKAYLNTAGAGARLSILFDDNDNTATSIKTTKTIDKTNIIYNLMGQKVKGSKPGLYIKNGKKVVMK